ncbi:DNA topoisomerase III [Bacillus sp. FJAT-45350]|uniref:DNA topoisomerase III n=1 Tax=Bacillus sp. FJAT-45350 TaxID=2011014 RepID=UPI000BB9BC09|nr:DNA topoisomerase III [Bacillus sp. FJAT-45350]
MKVIIAEKPDQGAKLAAPYPHKKRQGFIEIGKCTTFPDGAYLSWAVGHLCELKQPDSYNPQWKKWSLNLLPLLPDRFEHQVMKSKYKQFQIIKSLLKKGNINEVIIASDAGREGELIVRVILSLCQVKQPIKRLWLSSLTSKAVQEGFSRLLDESKTRSLYYEALSRSCADWLVGMNASRAYTLLLQSKGVEALFSTGRVQTPTLALIVKRENEIEQFKSEPFWEVLASFEMNGKKYDGKWHKEGETRLKEEKQATAIAQFCHGKDAEIQDVEKERKEYQPPMLFNLSALQATANKRFKYSPKKTLDIAQQLYVKGILSYPRTDSNYVTKEEALTFPDILNKIEQMPQYKEFFPLPKSTVLQNKRYVNEKKVTDHYAIIPTEQVTKLEALSGDERNIYDLVIRRLLAAHYEAAVVDYTTIHTVVSERATFITKGKAEVQSGWRKVIFSGKELASGDEGETNLPIVDKGEQGNVLDATVKESKTQPPKRYTEGQLITLMKTAGKHIEDETLEKVLMKTEGLGTEATRAGIITILKDRGYISVTKNQVFATEKGKVLIHAVGKSILASPEMTAKWEQRLSEIGSGSASPKVFMEQAKRLATKLVEEAKEDATNWSFSSYDLSKVSSEKGSKPFKKKVATVVGQCKKCNGKIIDRGTFYGCSNYTKTKCDFTISKKILGKTISQANAKLLLKEGATNTIKGLKKGEKVFDAKLVWNADLKKVEFSFTDSQQSTK